MVYRYQPLYEDPSYYGDEEEDQYDQEQEQEEDEGSGYYGA